MHRTISSIMIISSVSSAVTLLLSSMRAEKLKRRAGRSGFLDFCSEIVAFWLRKGLRIRIIRGVSRRFGRPKALI